MGVTRSLENDVLKLEVGITPALRIAVTDKRNGFHWECPDAPFVLHYWDARHFVVRQSPTTPERGWDFRLIPDEDRLAIQCSWPSGAGGFRAILQLDGPALDLLVPGRNQVENHTSEVRHMAVDALAAFGAAQTGEDGYLLIPREHGVLCRFDKTETHHTEKLICADGDRGLTAPVFGIARRNAALFGIITQGEFESELIIDANAGPDRRRNAIHPRLRLRLQSADELQEIDHRIRYTFFDRSASFVDMADVYRTYLTQRCGQPGLNDRIERRPALEYARQALTVHVHLAEKRQKTRLTGDGELLVKTRFAEVTPIAQNLQNAGIDRASIVLVGWNCEGRDGLYPTRFPVESAVGGADAMSQALAGVRLLGFQLGALDNYTDMYRRSPAFDDNYVAEQLGGQPWLGGVWAGGQAYIVCPAQALERHAQRDMRRLRDLGLEGLLFLDHCPGPGLLRCYHQDHPLTRSEYARGVAELIRTAQTTFGICRVSGISVFASLAADSCICPAARPPGVDELEHEWFADQDVPFLPTVLHGLVLLAVWAEDDPLRVAELGAAPVFDLTVDDCNARLPSMTQVYRRYAADIAPLADAFVESYDQPDEGLVKIAYSTGAQVLINRRPDTAAIDGLDVPPENFRVKA